MYGRKITPGLREGTPLHLYLLGSHQGVWNELALQVSKEIILCESLIDALTFWCAGFRNVTASYGVGGFTDDHRAAFRQHGVQRVWLLYRHGDDRFLDVIRQMLRAAECFHGRFAKTVFAGMRPAFIVFRHPGVDVALQLLQARIQPLPERYAVELVLHRAMETFADAIGLRRPRLGLGMVDILNRQVELILVVFPLAAVLGSAAGQNP
jgi:hypothetical protein